MKKHIEVYVRVPRRARPPKQLEIDGVCQKYMLSIVRQIQCESSEIRDVQKLRQYTSQLSQISFDHVSQPFVKPFTTNRSVHNSSNQSYVPEPQLPLKITMNELYYDDEHDLVFGEGEDLFVFEADVDDDFYYQINQVQNNVENSDSNTEGAIGQSYGEELSRSDVEASIENEQKYEISKHDMLKMEDNGDLENDIEYVNDSIDADEWRRQQEALWETVF